MNIQSWCRSIRRKDQIGDKRGEILWDRWKKYERDGDIAEGEQGIIAKGLKYFIKNDIIKIIDSIPNDEEDYSNIRDKALILIGFSGGFRRSELVAITKDDVEFVNEGVKIFVKKSKSDQSGEGMTKAIPFFKYVEYCPVDHLKNWMFVNRNNLVFPISDKNVALIVKKHALKAGLDEKKYAGHSLRSGFATTTAELGASERNIMAMTGHKSVDMVRRYIKEADLFKNNALNKLTDKWLKKYRILLKNLNYNKFN